MGDYTQLSQKERRQLKAFLEMGYKVMEIAERLGRHRSTIYRELNRNSKDDCYWPTKAHAKAKCRKWKKPQKLIVDSPCYKYVLDKLKNGWAPEQISGRMRILKLPYSICHETIYQYVYRHAKPHIFYYLPMQRSHRHKRRQRQSPSHYKGIRSINNRPNEVEKRTTLGHWEGDTIRFAGERRESVTTLVERKSRFVLLQKNIRSTSDIVMNNIRESINIMIQLLWKTITFDQGSEFSDFAKVERGTRCKVFYAHAHSPWLRGTNENTNKRLRRYLPKDACIKKIDQSKLDVLAEQLNGTPRKCLGYLTPKEVLFRAKLKPCRT